MQLRIARSLALAAALALATSVFAPIGWSAPQVGQPAAGNLTMQWLGWSHFRFTTPGGKVVLTNPFTQNPDSPIKSEDVTQADLILVPDGHGDEVGSTVDIAQRTGAKVIASGGGLTTWLIDQGVPREQMASMFASPGDRFDIDGITVRLVASFHGSELGQPEANAPYGGVASGFFITFENGYTVYFSGSSPAQSEQAMWAQMYQPDLAILHMGAQHEPKDFAMQVKLLQTDNPNLKMIVPHHNRVNPPEGQTTVAQVQSAIDSMGLGLKVTQPGLSDTITLTK